MTGTDEPSEILSFEEVGKLAAKDAVKRMVGYDNPAQSRLIRSHEALRRERDELRSAARSLLDYLDAPIRSGKRERQGRIRDLRAAARTVRAMAVEPVGDTTETKP